MKIETNDDPGANCAALCSASEVSAARERLLRKWEQWARHHYPDHAAGLISETREFFPEQKTKVIGI